MGRIAVAVAASLWVIPISIVVNTLVPDPYMDEIFHIPQAQCYCRGDFKKWDPMITTPPGLYYISLAYIASFFPGLWLAKVADSLTKICSSAVLRSTNGVLAIICSILVYDILIQLRPTLGERKATTYAIILALYPLNWFFTFLYYTDVASLTAVLAMYLASLKRHYFISALLGALAILCRQTNIVWMLFVAVDGAIGFVENFYANDTKILDEKIDYTKLDFAPGSSSLRRRRIGRHSNIVKLPTPKSRKHSGLIDEMLDLCCKVWFLKWELLLNFAPFLMALWIFTMIVLWNGSIVLGAKEAHVVSPHFAQLMYFGLASAAAVAPLHFNHNQLSAIYKSLLRNKILGFLQVLAALIIGFIAVHFFSIAHPYLLADNRHYTFYIWRKIIQAHWTTKYLLVPLYVYSWFSVINILVKNQKKIWVLALFLATAAVLVPAPLIEFRYYTVPIYFILLNSHIDKNITWIIMAILYLFIDVFTMAMFLFKTFKWDHEPGTQRFIW